MPSPLTDESRPLSLHWHYGLLTDGDLPLVRFRSYDRLGRVAGIGSRASHEVLRSIR